jgi:hypothetical protein
MVLFHESGFNKELIKEMSPVGTFPLANRALCWDRVELKNQLIRSNVESITILRDFGIQLGLSDRTIFLPQHLVRSWFIHETLTGWECRSFLAVALNNKASPIQIIFKVLQMLLDR